MVIDRLAHAAWKSAKRLSNVSTDIIDDRTGKSKRSIEDLSQIGGIGFCRRALLSVRMLSPDVRHGPEQKSACFSRCPGMSANEFP